MHSSTMGGMTGLRHRYAPDTPDSRVPGNMPDIPESSVPGKSLVCASSSQLLGDVRQHPLSSLVGDGGILNSWMWRMIMGASLDVCVASVADVEGRGGREEGCEKGSMGGGEEGEGGWKNSPLGCRRINKSDSLAHFKLRRMTRSLRSLEKCASGRVKLPWRRGGEREPPDRRLP